MAVCAGITYNSTTNIITILYNVADGTKGASFSNPYLVQDIVDTANANGWGCCYNISTGLYFGHTYITARVEATGASTFIQIKKESLTVYDPTKTTSYGIFSIKCNALFDQCSLAFTLNQGSTGQRAEFSSSSSNISITLIRFQILSAYSFTCAGNVSLAEGMLINIANAYWNISGSFSPSLSNVVNSSSGYGFILQGGLTLGIGLLAKDCTRGVLLGYGDFTLKNLIIQNCTYDVLLFPNQVGKVEYLIDSTIDLNKIGLGTATGNKDVTVYLQSTFNSIIENSTGGTLIIKDKDNNVVYTEIMSSNSMTETVITYATLSYIITDGVGVYAQTEHVPFLIEIIKSGYDTLIISNINITAGQPTTIRGEMVPTSPEPPSISSLEITHPDMSNNYGFIGVIVSGGTSPFTYSLNGGNPQSTPNFYSLSEGEYSILVKDSNDLEDSISGIKLKSERVADLYIAAIEMSQPTVYGDDGSIAIYAMAGVPPYEYKIDGYEYQSENMFTNLTASMYYLNAKDSVGTEVQLGQVNLEATLPEHPSISYISIVNPGISNDDGIITVGSSGGIGPYEYSLGYDGDWQSSNTFTNLEEGDYYIRVQDSIETVGGVSGIKLVAADAGIPSISGITLAPPSYGGSDGSIEVSAEYGYPPYEYYLDGGDYQDSNIFTGLGEGIYTVYVGDQRGNEGYIEGIVLSSSGIDYPRITVTSIVHPGVLDNNGSITVQVSGGVGPYLYSLDGSSYQSSNVFSDLSEDEYDIYVRDDIGTESMLQGVSLKKTILYNQSIVANITSDSTIVASIIPEENIVVSITTEDVIIS